MAVDALLKQEMKKEQWVAPARYMELKLSLTLIKMQNLKAKTYSLFIILLSDINRYTIKKDMWQLSLSMKTLMILGTVVILAFVTFLTILLGIFNTKVPNTSPPVQITPQVHTQPPQ
jgi:hypothetical protein